MLEILNNMKTKTAWEEYSPLVGKGSVGEEIWEVMQALELWYGMGNESVDDWEHLKAFFRYRVRPKWEDTKLVIYDNLFDRLAAIDDDDSVSKVVKNALIERHYATEIVKVALDIREGGTGSLTSVGELIEAWETDIGKARTSELVVTDDLETISRETSADAGYEWRLEELNYSLGKLSKGKLVIVAARPDTGKTTFMMSEAGKILEQLPMDKKLYWFNNEEEGMGVKKRLICSILGITTAEFDSNPMKVKGEIEKAIGDLGRIVLVDAPALSVSTINKFLRKNDAGLIVIDQLWKVHGFTKTASNDAARTTMLYNQAREWAKQYAPVLVASQAGGEASGEKWVGMEQLYGSKTGAQGEADAIITIGRSYDPEEDRDARFLSIVKNKFPSPKDSAYRNGRYEVKIAGDVARYVGFS